MQYILMLHKKVAAPHGLSAFMLVLLALVSNGALAGERSINTISEVTAQTTDTAVYDDQSALSSSKHLKLQSLKDNQEPDFQTKLAQAKKAEQSERLMRITSQLKAQQENSNRFYSNLNAKKYGMSLAANSALMSASSIDNEKIADFTINESVKAQNKPSALSRLSNLATRSISRFKQTGIASWYGRQFQGKITANGETYDMNALTAAHGSLPMSCYIKVTNEQNGKSVVVKVNDRVADNAGNIVDLSYAAAKKIGLTDAKTGKVSIEKLTETQ